MTQSSNPEPELGAEDEAAEAEAMRRLREELASAPVGDVVAQAAAHLATFAYVRLGIPPEENQRFRDLDAARLLIDALGGLIGALQGRLGQSEAALQEALAALRMTYAQAAAGAAGQPPPGPGATQPPPDEPVQPPGDEPRPHRPSGLWVPGQD